jgi:hypothetical protein
VPADTEAKLLYCVPAIQQATVGVVLFIRTGSPREEVVHLGRVYGIDNDVNGHRQHLG